MTPDVGVGTVIFNALRKFEVMEMKLEAVGRTELWGSGTLKGGSQKSSTCVLSEFNHWSSWCLVCCQNSRRATRGSDEVVEAARTATRTSRSTTFRPTLVRHVHRLKRLHIVSFSSLPKKGTRQPFIPLGSISRVSEYQFFFWSYGGSITVVGSGSFGSWNRYMSAHLPSGKINWFKSIRQMAPFWGQRRWNPDGDKMITAAKMVGLYSHCRLWIYPCLILNFKYSIWFGFVLRICLLLHVANIADVCCQKVKWI